MADADHVLATGLTPPDKSPSTRARVERLAARAVAGFSWIFALQVIPVLVSQAGDVEPAYTLVMAGVLFASLAWLAVASIIGRTVRIAALAVSYVYVVALLLWISSVSEPAAFLGIRPWLWYLLTVATACAALAMPIVAAAVYTVVVPALYGLVLAISAGPGAVRTAVLDALYAVLFASVLLAIMTILRQAASHVDERQSAALRRYESAVREHALEAERVEVDAIVHDSVLTTLLSAAAARSPDASVIAAAMARDALGLLDTSDVLVAPGRATDAVGAARLRERLVQAAHSFTVPFSIEPADRASIAVPVHVAEALYSAAVQAMVNSVQHAGGVLVHRSLAVHVTGGGGLVVVVRDDGRGFAVSQIPPERLGVEVSIRERVAMAGGRASVESAPGQGATITLEWQPADETTESGSDRRPTRGRKT